MGSDFVSDVSRFGDGFDLVSVGHDFTSRDSRLQSFVSQLPPLDQAVNFAVAVLHGGYLFGLSPHLSTVGAILIAKVYNVHPRTQESCT